MSLWIILLSLHFQIVFSEIIYECKMKSFWWRIECFLSMDEVGGFMNTPGLIRSWWNYQNSLICLNLQRLEHQLHNPLQDISLKSLNIVFTGTYSDLMKVCWREFESNLTQTLWRNNLYNDYQESLLIFL